MDAAQLLSHVMDTSKLRMKNVSSASAGMWRGDYNRCTQVAQIAFVLSNPFEGLEISSDTAVQIFLVIRHGRKVISGRSLIGP